jgi:hypothetical protein
MDAFDGAGPSYPRLKQPIDGDVAAKVPKFLPNAMTPESKTEKGEVDTNAATVKNKDEKSLLGAKTDSELKVTSGIVQSDHANAQEHEQANMAASLDGVAKFNPSMEAGSGPNVGKASFAENGMQRGACQYIKPKPRCQSTVSRTVQNRNYFCTWNSATNACWDPYLFKRQEEVATELEKMRGSPDFQHGLVQWAQQINAARSLQSGAAADLLPENPAELTPRLATAGYRYILNTGDEPTAGSATDEAPAVLTPRFATAGSDRDVDLTDDEYDKLGLLFRMFTGDIEAEDYIERVTKNDGTNWFDDLMASFVRTFRPDPLDEGFTQPAPAASRPSTAAKFRDASRVHAQTRQRQQRQEAGQELMRA